MCVLDWSHQITGQLDRGIQQKFCFSTSHNPLFIHLCSFISLPSFSPSWNDRECLNNKCLPHRKYKTFGSADNIRAAKDYFLNDGQGFSFGQSKLCFKSVKKKKTWGAIHTFCQSLLSCLRYWGVYVQPLSQFVQLMAVCIFPCQPSTKAQAVMDMSDTQMTQMRQDL